MEVWADWNYPEITDATLYDLCEIINAVTDRFINRVKDNYHTLRQLNNAYAEMVMALRHYMSFLIEDMENYINPDEVSLVQPTRWRTGRYLLEVI